MLKCYEERTRNYCHKGVLIALHWGHDPHGATPVVDIVVHTVQREGAGLNREDLGELIQMLQLVADDYDKLTQQFDTGALKAAEPCTS